MAVAGIASGISRVASPFAGNGDGNGYKRIQTDTKTQWIRSSPVVKCLSVWLKKELEKVTTGLVQGPAGCHLGTKDHEDDLDFRSVGPGDRPGSDESKGVAEHFRERLSARAPRPD
jgi:hypothetical protein